MRQNQKRYIIANATRKEATFCKKTGKDLRSIDQKKGFVVSFRDREDRQHLLHPDRQPVIIDEVTSGILQLKANGHITIKEVTDIMEALKEHAAPPKVRPTALVRDVANAGATAPQEERGLFPEQDAAPGERQARAVQMGEDKHVQRGGNEHEGAINPSGNPNFVVKAPTGDKQQNRRERRNNRTAPAAD